MHHDFKQDIIFLYQEMSQFIKKISTPLSIVIILIAHNIHAQDSMNAEIWKMELQILLGFTGEEVDGAMGIETFNALKRFAYHHDLEDVVLRGEFGDIEHWGFGQYLIKYHPYWIREIKNQRIFSDLHDKEYLRQADETLYTFEIAIQNAKLEVERLGQAKSRAKRLAQEKQESEQWEIEKQEAERLTVELRKSIMIAQVEVDKWSLERLRTKRLESEKEQLELLSARKAEATRLTYELEDIISNAKVEIDRLIEENKKMKLLIENSEKTETMAEELLNELTKTNENLKTAQGQIQVLSERNDTLDIKLQDAKIEIKNMIQAAKRPWWKFWKKKVKKSTDTPKENISKDTKRPWWKFWKKDKKNKERKKQKDQTE